MIGTHRLCYTEQITRFRDSHLATCDIPGSVLVIESDSQNTQSRGMTTMKVICDRAALANALTLVGGVIAQRSPKPVLECVKITAKDGLLTLSGTDLEASLRITTDKVDIQDEGEALLPVEKLNQICQNLLDPTLTLVVKDDAATIRGATSIFKIYGHSVKDFPEMPDISSDTADFTIPADDLCLLIERTIFATARENSRYAINGVLLSRNGKTIEMVATDGRRLALAKGTCSTGSDGESNCIVPTKGLSLLAKLTHDAETEVAATIEDNRIIFAIGEEGNHATLSSNLVEGTFPPYQDVIPKDLDKQITFDVDVLETATRQAALLTNEESKGVRFTFEKGGLSITSHATELGEANISIPLEEYDEGEFEIGFNPTFIIDALKQVDETQVIFELKASNKPGVIKVGSEFLYVIMPVSLS